MIVSPVVLCVTCPHCGSFKTPLGTLQRAGYEHDDMFCGVVSCVLCCKPFPVEIDAVREAQNACLVALGED